MFSAFGGSSSTFAQIFLFKFVRLVFLPTAREGNVFRSVCHSVSQGGGVCIQGGGDSAPGDVHPGGWVVIPHPPSTTGYGQQAGSTHPAGMHTC